jgi:hypothetical protein
VLKFWAESLAAGCEAVEFADVDVLVAVLVGEALVCAPATVAVSVEDVGLRRHFFSNG